MPKGLGEGRKGSWERVIYYRLSLFVLLLLRFTVSPKSSSARTARPSQQPVMYVCELLPFPNQLQLCPGAGGCQWILKRVLLSPLLRSPTSAHTLAVISSSHLPSLKEVDSAEQWNYQRGRTEPREPAGSLGPGVIQRRKEKKTLDSLWANLTPTAQLAQSTEKVGVPQVGQGLSVPQSTHLCLCLTELLGPLKALSSDFWTDQRLTCKRTNASKPWSR